MTDEPHCKYCTDTGWVVVRSATLAYAFPGGEPIPEDTRGFADVDCWFCKHEKRDEK